MKIFTPKNFYTPEQVGGQMSANYIAIARGSTIRQAMSELVRQAGENDNIATLYVVDDNGLKLSTILTDDDYFDLDLVQCTKNEVFVDLGAYTGDTLASYLRCYGGDCYRRIYCYEMAPDSFAVLSERFGALQGNAPEPPLAEIVYDRLRAPLVVVLAAL